MLKPKEKENLSLGGGDKKSEKTKSGFTTLKKAINPIDVTETLAKEGGKIYFQD